MGCCLPSASRSFARKVIVMMSLWAQAAFEAVTNEYKALEAAITDPAKRAAMADVYKQPWRQ